MKLELIPNTDERLFTKCEVVNPRKPDPEHGDWEPIVIQMFMLMKEHDGCGLAAPQVGITKRLFVLDIHGEQFVCFNPRVANASKETEIAKEGCLSYPGVFLPVERPVRIKAEFQTVSGLKRTQTMRGLHARAFLHELDHLNGVVFTDRAIKDASV